jgi:hypothetical protein
MKLIYSISKGADLNQLVQGGQLYQAFPISQTSLAEHSTEFQHILILWYSEKLDIIKRYGFMMLGKWTDNVSKQ